jgi:hypothetical protein
MATQQDFAWPWHGPISDQALQQLIHRGRADKGGKRHDSRLCPREGGRIALVLPAYAFLRRQQLSGCAPKVDPATANKTGISWGQNRDSSVDSRQPPVAVTAQEHATIDNRRD